MRKSGFAVVVAVLALGALVLASCARGGASDDGPGGPGGGGGDGDEDGDRPGLGEEGDAEEGCVGVGCAEPFDPEGDGGRGVILTPDGSITLGGETAGGQYIWIANTREGTVSKIDTRARVEVARYVTGPNRDTSPSRTTVGFSGDCVVANRDLVGAATKFYGAACPDADGDGVVETSHGPDEVLGWMQDECMAWSTPVGAVARGSAFEIRSELDDAAHEYVWIGSTTDGLIREIDAESGELTGRVIQPADPYGVFPYGVAIGPDHQLWTFGMHHDSDFMFAQWSNRLLAFDTGDLSLREFPIPQSFYGLAVDSEGRVWIGGTVGRFDPATGTWTQPTVAVAGAGIAVDAEGNAYTGEEGYGLRIDADDMTVTSVPGVGGHGWAIDFDGFIWSIPYEGAVAHVSDPDTLEEVATIEGLVGAYTYSDMTGFQLSNVTQPVGTYPHVFEGCPSGLTTWEDASWEAFLPAGSSISLSAKTADDPASLVAAPSVSLGVAPPDEPPVSIEAAFATAGVAPGSLLRLEVTLQSRDLEHAPVVSSLTVTKRCEEVFE